MNDNSYQVALMDFPDRDIFIIAESNIEIAYRANACAKEPFTVEWIRQMAHKGVFYDIGANVGSYSLIAASLMSGDDVIVAFEPVYFNFYRLNENIIMNKYCNRIIPLNLGLTSRNAVEKIYLKDLDFGVTNRALGTERSDLFTRTLCMTLDAIVKTGAVPFPQHIKIDVDGDELAVLEGGRETFYDNRLRSVMIEVNDSDQEQTSKIYEFLSASGLKLFEKNQLRSKNMSNDLFIRE